MIGCVLSIFQSRFLKKRQIFIRFIFDKRVYASFFLQIVPVSAYKHYSFVFVRFCKGFFEKNYKATIGVDFEMERFEVLGVPFSVQLWVCMFPQQKITNDSLRCCGGETSWPEQNTSQWNHALITWFLERKKEAMSKIRYKCPAPRCVCVVMDWWPSA